MISVCIPVYNHYVVPLAETLLAQARECGVEMEMVCIDDCSTDEWRERNRRLGELGKYVLLDENVGRARIRNMFTDHAKGDYLLFLDNDSVVGNGFVVRYAKVLEQRPQVVVGGRVYDPASDTPGQHLRYLYGTRVESLAAAQRAAHPYRSFMTNNFIVARGVMSQVRFDERLCLYGHEDTLFGYRLQQQGIPILHIDNPVVNGEVEDNALFLEKTREAVRNLVLLDGLLAGDEGFADAVRLLGTVHKLRRWGLCGAVRAAYHPLRSLLERQLTDGKNITISAFNFYKLGYYLEVEKAEEKNNERNYTQQIKTTNTMKNIFKYATAVALGLLVTGSAAAQVIESKTYKDGSVYQGEFNHKDKREGRGTMTWPNGDRYEGQWQKGFQEGEGTYTWANGLVYQGNWVKSQISGRGVFRFPNGNVLDGEWTGVGTGTGVLTWADGTRYEGPLVSGSPQGRGVKQWPDGKRYDGDFVQGHMTGEGTCKFADGASYTGHWLNDQFDGKGKYISAEGEVREGTFRAGIFQK